MDEGGVRRPPQVARGAPVGVVEGHRRAGGSRQLRGDLGDPASRRAADRLGRPGSVASARRAGDRSSPGRGCPAGPRRRRGRSARALPPRGRRPGGGGRGHAGDRPRGGAGAGSTPASRPGAWRCASPSPPARPPTCGIRRGWRPASAPPAMSSPAAAVATPGRVARHRHVRQRHRQPARRRTCDHSGAARAPCRERPLSGGCVIRQRPQHRAATRERSSRGTASAPPPPRPPAVDSGRGQGLG